MNKNTMFHMIILAAVLAFCPLDSMAIGDNKVVVVPLVTSGAASGDTRITLSPFNMTPIEGIAATTMSYSYKSAYLQINSIAIEDEWPQLPINLPHQIGGTELKLKSLKVCYEMSTTSVNIGDISIKVLQDDGTISTPFSDPANRSSTAWKCDDIEVSPPVQLSGSSSITFMVSFPNGSTYMKIGTVDLTLGP